MNRRGAGDSRVRMHVVVEDEDGYGIRLVVTCNNTATMMMTEQTTVPSQHSPQQASKRP